LAATKLIGSKALLRAAGHPVATFLDSDARRVNRRPASKRAASIDISKTAADTHSIGALTRRFDISAVVRPPGGTDDRRTRGRCFHLLSRAADVKAADNACRGVRQRAVAAAGGGGEMPESIEVFVTSCGVL